MKRRPAHARSCQATRLLRTSVRTWGRAPAVCLRFEAFLPISNGRSPVWRSLRRRRDQTWLYFLSRAETDGGEDRQDRALGAGRGAGCGRMHRRAEACTATSRPLRRSDLPSGRRTSLAGSRGSQNVLFFLLLFPLLRLASFRRKHNAILCRLLQNCPSITLIFFFIPRRIPERNGPPLKRR